jgi:RNA polymerase sigma-70 factor, ECF subfamily
VPFSSLGEDGDREPLVDADRFRPEDDRWAGGWKSFPQPLPEERLLERETLAMIEAAIGELPERQHTVIVMRDVEGWTAEDVEATAPEALLSAFRAWQRGETLPESRQN